MNVPPEFVALLRAQAQAATDPELLPGEWSLLEGRPCVQRLPGGHDRCRQPSVVGLRRGKSIWPYCAEHLGGRRYVDGRLEALIRVRNDQVEATTEPVSGEA